MVSLPLTAYINTPFDKMASILAPVLQGEMAPEQAEAIGGLFLHRALHLLREGSRDEILNEGSALSLFLQSETGLQLAQSYPDLYGKWRGFSGLLTEAARRSDRAAVDSILRSQGGHGRAVLEMLAEHGGPISRRAVRERLEITESHLSHVLRDLAEADLIVRSRLGREVALDLGPVGREVVERSVAPAWVSYLCDRIKHISSLELRIEPETLTAELLRRGAPSRTVARQLAEAVLQWPNELTPRARQNALFLVARCDMQVNLSVPRRALFARTKAGSR